MTSLGAVVLAGCGDSDDDSGSSGSSTVFTVDAAGVGPHTHTFSVPDATLATPPAAGFTTATSSTSGHSHSITLTQADLTNIAANMAVAANTTIVSAHAHAFTFP
jgi:hypothetical protein